MRKHLETLLARMYSSLPDEAARVCRTYNCYDYSALEARRGWLGIDSIRREVVLKNAAPMGVVREDLSAVSRRGDC